jgi:hypothetical protein
MNEENMTKSFVRCGLGLLSTGHKHSKMQTFKNANIQKCKHSKLQTPMVLS